MKTASSQLRMASNDDQVSEFLFGSVRPWWDKHKWLRRASFLALKTVDRSYVRWSKARVSPRRFKKIQERLDREYPPEKFSPSNMIGREKEFNLFFFSSRRRHTRCSRDWSSDVCSSDLHRPRWVAARSMRGIERRSPWV